ncbi:hypothetical protein ACEPAH_8183 [Sanghuangporus vaninii]
MVSQHHYLLILVFKTVGLICQTLFYGVYAALIPFSTHFLLKRKTMSKANKLMFSITIFMFLLSTAYWVTSVGSEISTLVDTFSSSPDRPTVWSNLFELFNSLLLINYVLTDGVVVWRAWVLCKDGSKKILMVPLFLLLCTSLSVLATVSIRAAMLVIGEKKLKPIIDVMQMVNLVLSLLTNICATSIIGWRAWQHRQEVREVVSKERGTNSKVGRILVLLVESGLIYCISGLFVLLASLVRLPHGTLGDIYTTVHVQIAGIYPTVVLTLVSQKRSLKEGVFSTVGNTSAVVETRLESMNFGTNPVIETSMISHDERSYHEDGDEGRSSAESRSEMEKDYSGRMEEKP